VIACDHELDAIPVERFVDHARPENPAQTWVDGSARAFQERRAPSGATQPSGGAPFCHRTAEPTLRNVYPDRPARPSRRGVAREVSVIAAM